MSNADLVSRENEPWCVGERLATANGVFATNHADRDWAFDARNCQRVRNNFCFRRDIFPCRELEFVRRRIASSEWDAFRLAAEPGEIMDSVRLAEVYAFRGMNDEAFATLQEKKADLELDRDSGTAWAGRLQTEARISPFLKTLYADPRWTALIANLR